MCNIGPGRIMTLAMDERKEAPRAGHPVVARGGPGCQTPTDEPREADEGVQWWTRGPDDWQQQNEAENSFEQEKLWVIFCQSVCVSSPEADLFAGTVSCFLCSL